MFPAGPPIWLIMFLVLLLPVLFVLIIGLVVYAIVKNRQGIVAAVGGGLLLFLAGGLTLALFGVRSIAPSSNAQVHIGPTSIDANFNPVAVSPAHSYQSSMKVSWGGLVFVAAVPLLLMFALFRNATVNKS